MKEHWVKVDAIIIDGEIEKDTIPSGTRLLCGNCGEPIGTTIKPLKFPFHTGTLVDAIYKPQLRLISYGVQHKICESVITRQEKRGVVFHTKKSYEELQLATLN